MMHISGTRVLDEADGVQHDGQGARSKQVEEVRLLTSERAA